MKKSVISLLCVLLVAAGGFALYERYTTQKQSNTSAQTSTRFNMQQHSLTSADSLWVIVNKTRRLNPANYTPANLVTPNIPLRDNITNDEKQVSADMTTALEKMVDDANTQGVHFNLQSGYRSYQFQVKLYNTYVREQSKSVADSQSARPGYSEHQTGLAVDLGGTSKPSCNVEDCFAKTIEGKWLAANAYSYGFIIRYPSGKEDITGYVYEPWHIRYVGTALSEQMHEHGIETLEQFFDLPNAPNYK